MKKTIVVGVSSSIAAYKSADLVSRLLKKGYDVEVIMTKNATEFITPLTFLSLTKHKTCVDTFDRNVQYDVEHISLAKKADLFIIAPATANIIAKTANGLADDMLSTTFLASKCPKIIAPAMNTAMYENPITQDNLRKLRDYGVAIVDPDDGLLACGDVGKGRLADIETLLDAIDEHIHIDKPLKGKKIIVSAGPTIERIDPVRYITNHSTGKMGYAIAEAARNMGADVTLVSGRTNLRIPSNIRFIQIESAREMFEAIRNIYDEADYVIKSAAVADFRPKTEALNKIKKEDSDGVIELERTDDILAYLGSHKTHQKLCGFAMETENVLNNAKEKLVKKNCDMLVLNNLRTEGAGFGVDTNVVTVLTKDNTEELECMPKKELAYIILEKLMEV